jgi:hypothetical protein
MVECICDGRLMNINLKSSFGGTHGRNNRGKGKTDYRR